jgi:hypothetical protein
MQINTGLLNVVYILEAFQALPLIAIAGWTGYLIIEHKRFSQKAKLWLWALFTFSIVVAVAAWSVAFYNYVHYERSIYRYDNSHFARQQTS